MALYDMNEHLRPTGRCICVDHAVESDLDGATLRNYQFERLVAVKKHFVNCDFSFSQFDSAYLRNCTFDTCKFIGCKFKSSNLRGSRFTGCVFNYAEFNETHVDLEIIASGLPGVENLQQKFARSLRINFQQIGDADAANRAIKAELAATRVHLWKAWRSRESYYRSKYQGIDRARVFIEWITFSFLDFYWGNGESIWKLLRFLIVMLAAITVWDVLLLGKPSTLHGYLVAVGRSSEVFFGVLMPDEFNGVVLSLIALLRYVMLACLVSVIVKRFSRR